MLKVLIKKIKEAFISVTPVTLMVLLLELFNVVDLSKRELAVFMISAICLIIGIGLFNLGADIAMSPMGNYIGVGLSRTRKKNLLLAVSFAMGVLITVAEPDLSVLAKQVSAVLDEKLLIVTVGLGVGIFLVISVLKITLKKDLSMLLMLFYMMLFALAALMIEQGKSDFLPMSFDSGGVTTGPITVPFLMALGIGIAQVVGGRNSNENSFGMVALCSVGPVLAVTALSLLAKGRLSYTIPDYSMETVLGGGIMPIVFGTAKEILIALGLIVAFFALLQFLVLKLPARTTAQLALGVVYTFVGLLIFLTAVKIGFLPVGYKLGVEMATAGKEILIGFGFLIGLVVVLAEPAVHVLQHQVEDVTEGIVPGRSMLIALSIGVAISIGLSMIRIVYGFSLLYYLIPGYFISLTLSLFVPGIYTAIAFDSGGVASGPLTSSFILPFAIGACTVYAGEQGILSYAFGIVAMVAMTPLITIQVLGFRALFTRKMKEKRVIKDILGKDDEQIIYFEKRIR